MRADSASLLSEIIPTNNRQEMRENRINITINSLTHTQSQTGEEP